ncbi:MAG: hypothetical protein JW750_09615 [Anaerolineaceae bacterium]|nr:hypothetical protein [Anaerolineaceae bacterium]
MENTKKKLLNRHTIKILKILWVVAVFWILVGLFASSLPTSELMFGAEGGFWDHFGRIPNAYQSFLAQHFSLKDAFLRFKHDFQYGILQENRFPIVLGGQNGWLYYTGERNMEDYQNAFPISDDELMKIYSNLEQINRSLTRQGKKLIVVIAPNRETIYPDYLPSGVNPVNNTPDRLDQVLAYMEKMHAQTTILDLREPLLAAKEAGHQVYFKTDTHWNQYGAFIAYQEICKEIQKDYPEHVCHGRDEWEIEYIQYSGDMVKLMPTNLTIEESIPNFVPLFEAKAVQDPPDPLTRDRYEFVYSELPEGSAPLTLVEFRDSFSMDLLKFLREDFQKAVYEWNFNWNRDLVEEYDPDVVIIEVVERYIHALAWFDY